MIIGYYNEYGYRIVEGDKEVYTAGNCNFDSTTIVDPDDSLAHSLSQIRKNCKKTCKEIVSERGGKFAGIEYEESDMTEIFKFKAI